MIHFSHLSRTPKQEGSHLRPGIVGPLVLGRMAHNVCSKHATLPAVIECFSANVVVTDRAMRPTIYFTNFQYKFCYAQVKFYFDRVLRHENKANEMICNSHMILT